MANLELIQTEWFDADAIRLPNYKVGRINYGKGRGYIKIVNGELEKPFRVYTSLTTAINTCAPMEDPLLQWYCKLGYEEAKRQLIMYQHYGTLMHLLIGEYCTGNFFDFDQIDEKVTSYISEKDYWEKEVKEWPDRLKWDLAAWITFAQDHKIKPLGIEYVLVSKRGFGTLIDLVCKITVDELGDWGEVYKSGPRKGQPKLTKKPVEKTAIINFKSGRHGFYRSNGIQALCEKDLWEENFPDMKLDAAYNWSPKEWIINPDSNFKEWTKEDISKQEIDCVLKMAKIRFGSKALKKKHISISGLAVSTRSVRSCIHQLSVKQFASLHYSSLMDVSSD